MLLLIALFACRATPPPPAPFWDGHETRVLGEPEGPACTVVVIHGHGTNPGSILGLFDGYDGELQVMAPRAPTKWREPDGYTWFPRVHQTEGAVMATAIAERADALADAIPSLPMPHPVRGRPILTGFSQGGMLSWSAATRHPDTWGAVLPLSGWLPAESYPTGTPGSVKIHGFHGQLDNVLPLRETDKLVSHLQTAGWDVAFSTYPNVTHSVPQPMRGEFYAALKEACARQ